MAQPTTRTEFKNYCLRRLGEPVIKINVADEQIEDRIDEALEYFRDYHFDGMERSLYRHEVTADDVERFRNDGRHAGEGRVGRYIDLPHEIHGVKHIMPIGGSYTSAGNLFNLRYQLFLNDLYSFNSTNFMPWVMVKRHLESIEETFIGDEMFRFNRKTHRLFLDNDADFVNAGTYIIIDCHIALNPDTHSDVWNDPWLKDYATALIKRQWGTNLSKFAGVALPGGITLDKDAIIREASEEINVLKGRIITDFSYPLGFELN